MKKHRKLVALLIALTFLFSVAAPAMAASDSAEQSAVTKLMNLGIIEGDPSGELRLGDNITRAEFAKVAVISAGLKEAGNLLKDTPPKFSDVKVSEWYTGWINLAASQGYVKGDPDGKFRPNDNISNAEVITILLRILGYNDNLPGDWPTDYIAKAATLGVTKNVSFDAKAPAVRGSAFLMAKNTLEKKVVSYDKDEDKFIEKDYTLMEDALDVEKIDEVYVTAIPRIDSKLKDNQIKIVGKTYKAIGIDFEEVFGAEVTAWINDDDEVISIEVDSEVLYDAIEWDADKEELTLVDADEEYDLAEDVIVYIDGKKSKVSNLGDFDYAKVVLDEDGDVAFIDAYSWNGFLIVEEVDGYDVFGYGEELDVEDYAIVKEGKTISADDLIEGDILFYSTSAEYAEVYNNAVEGDISRVYSDRISVSKTDYLFVNPVFGAVKYLDGDDLEDLNEDIAKDMRDEGPVSVFVDRNGEAVFVLGDIGAVSKTTFIGYLGKNSVQFNDRGTAKWTLDVINESGTLVKYNISENDIKKATFFVKPEGAKWFDEDTLQAVDMVKNTVVEIEIDADGDVTKVEFLGSLDKSITGDREIRGLSGQGSGDGVFFEVGDSYVAGFKIKKNAVVFLADDYKTNLNYDKDDNKLEVSTLDKVEFEKINEARIFVNDKAEIIAIVVIDSDRSTDRTEHMVIATKDAVKVAGEDTWRLQLSVEGAKDYYYTKKNAFTAGNAGAVKKGDFLVVEINDVTNEIDIISGYNAGLTDRIASGEISEVKLGNKTFKIGDDLYRLLGDTNVLDGTDGYKAISLSSIKVGDTVKALKLTNSSPYVKLVVRTAEVGEEASTRYSATITSDYLLTAGDEVTVKLTVSGAVYSDFSLVVFEGANVVKTAEFTSAAISASGQNFAISTLGLESNKGYTLKVIKKSDGSVIATKEVVTGTITEP